MLTIATLLAALVAAAPKHAPAPKPAAPAKAAPAPWDAGFGAPAADVAKAAAALSDPPGKKIDADVLLEEGIFSFDDAGRLTYTYRMVYRPLTPSAAESWAEASRPWSPWHQERPVIRARAIDPDGTEHLLDPKTLSEAAADEAGDVMYFDRRILRGPIPHVVARSVVEEESVVRDTAPIFDRGTVHRWWVGRRTHTRTIRLVVSAPEKLPLAYVLGGGLAGAPVERREGGRRTLTFTWPDVPARKAGEANLPPERAAPPFVAFGTGASWQQIASAYADIVDRQLATAELAARAKEIAGPSTDRREVAQKLLTWVSGRVRYTGLELGEAAIVPVPPAETLKRGYGDCKDLSLLLTGLLRALGHPAELALVRTEADDVADLPGMGEFDHAIVHVPGTPELWIDPTDPDTAAGELPRGDQGRLALLANRAAKKLVRTPDVAAEANRVEIDREVVMGEAGRSHAVEKRVLRGSRAALERHAHRRTPAAELQKQDEADAQRVFADAKLVSAKRDGLDGAGAVTVRTEVDQSRWGVTGDNDAEVIVSGDLALERLPEALRPKSPDDGAEAKPAEARADDDADADEDAEGGDADSGSQGAKADKPRTADVMVSEAHETLVRYRVVPPPGFTAGPLPQAVKVAVGPATYERTSGMDPDGAVRVVHRFVLAKRRLSAKDAEKLKAALADLGDDPRVKFERVSEKLLVEGKGREALDEIRRLVALHPTEARHHTHLALALVRLGMGDAARKEARRAVELEPSSAWAHRVLANVLEHDRIGRWLSPGCDLDGAAAAQRRAAELDKDQPATTRARLAFILEHGERCARWAKGAKLDEAAKVLRALRKDLKTKEQDGELLEVYLHSDRFSDARALAKEMKDGPERRAALLAAVAALDGAPAAIQEASRLATADRAAALQGASLPLLRARRYPEAAALLEASGQGATNSAELRARAAMIKRIQRSEDIRYDGKDPATVFPRLVRDVLRGAGASRVSEYVTGGDKATEEMLTGFRVGFEQATRGEAAAGLSMETISDIALSLVESSKEGDDEAAWRVRYTFAFSPAPVVVHTVPTDRGWRVIAETPDYPALAGAAWRRVDAGKLEAARRLLRFAKDDAPKSGEASGGAILTTLWTHGDEAGAAELRTAAIALAAMGGDAGATRALEEARAKESDPLRRRALGWALAASHFTGKRWEKVLAIAPELAGGDRAAAVFDLQAMALVQLHRRAELVAAASARRKAAPDDLEPLRWLRRSAAMEGDVDAAIRIGGELLATGRADPDDWNETAWAALFKDPLAPNALEQARKAVLLTQEKSGAVLHTLAMVHAERGDGAEAIQVLVKSLAARGNAEPGSAEWLVIGRVAEHYGLLDEALAAYARVGPEKGEILGSHLLATRRLERIGKKASPESAPRAAR